MYIIANGGMKFHDIENTIDAIMLTKNASYVDGVLIDIRLTLDNEIVVFKDDDLSKNTLSKGFVSKTNYYDLKKVKLPSKIHKYYISTLDEVLRKYQSNKFIILNLHDSLNKNELLVDKTIGLLNNYPNYNFYLETSSIDILGYLIEKANGYKIGPRVMEYPISCTNNISFCDISGNNINENVNSYREVLVRNINCMEDVTRFLKSIDNEQNIFIITDYPKRVNSCVNKSYNP